ncbi:MAG: hypothetical protein OXG88_00365 [Gammaproteobacteria bacterium]|nr:hypothetical protein [Gammaproteobacteria bacterium]
MKSIANASVKQPKREPRSAEELALSLRTPALRTAIAKRKKATKK